MTTARTYGDKTTARLAVWDRMQVERIARFPFPPHGRIPNFDGAARAAERLFQHSPWNRARSIKINPDAPQRYVREIALRRGMTVFVPTPRLRGGFMRLDPAAIPTDKIPEAAKLSTLKRWADIVALRDLQEMDAIVTGSVAVTRDVGPQNDVMVPAKRLVAIIIQNRPRVRSNPMLAA